MLPVSSVAPAQSPPLWSILSSWWFGRKVSIFPNDRMALRSLFNDTQSRLSALPKLGPCQIIEKYVFPPPTPGCLNPEATKAQCIKKIDADTHDLGAFERLALSQSGNIIISFKKNSAVYFKILNHQESDWVDFSKSESFYSVEDFPSMVIGPNGYLYIMDDAYGVWVYKENFEKIQRITFWSDQEYIKIKLERLLHAEIAIGVDGTFIVQSYPRHQLFLFNENGKYLSTISNHNIIFDERIHLKVDPTSGNIAFCCKDKHLYIYDKTGAFLHTIVNAGRSFAFDAAGQILACDENGFKWFNAQGELYRTYPAKLPEHSKYPGDIVISPTGKVYRTNGFSLTEWQFD